MGERNTVNVEPEFVNRGTIEVICGSMFSGKSEELQRRARLAKYANNNVQAFKPALDDRYDPDKIVSHDGRDLEAISIGDPSEILFLLNRDTDVVVIDEAQFFNGRLIKVVRMLAYEKNIRVIIATLDKDFRGEPFGVAPFLMAIANKLDKLQAICVTCGEDASCSQRLINGEPAHYSDTVVKIGAEESYEPRCEYHHEVPGKPDSNEEIELYKEIFDRIKTEDGRNKLSSLAEIAFMDPTNRAEMDILIDNLRAKKD
jgi:thymidine kinase